MNTSAPKDGNVVMMKDTDDRWKKWRTRFWSTVVMVALFAGLIWLGHMALIVFTLVIQCWSFYEILSIRVAKHQKEKANEDSSEIIPFYKLLDVWFFVATLITVNGKTFYGDFHLFFSDGIAHFFMTHHAFISFTLYCVGFVAFVLTLEKGKYRRQFRQLTWTVMTMICVVFAGSFHIVNILRGLFWFLLPCLLVVCNDIWAFVWGFHFGKTSLIALSPRKTWEGFIGAVFSTIAFAFVAAYFLSQYDFLVCPREELNAGRCVIDPVFQLT
ncbi:MAG: phosphatidate cytidylyltransferase, partial [archaeon]|nr:phosphatidate cytidylyltransferase [archaeon]